MSPSPIASAFGRLGRLFPALAVGCLLVASAAPSLAAPPAVKKGPAPAKDHKPDIKSTPCPEGASVLVFKKDIDLVCKNETTDCETDVPLVAKNCTKEFMEFVKLEIFESGRRQMVLEFSPASIVGPNGAWQEKIPWTTPGTLDVVVYFRPPGSGSNPDSARADITVHNKLREKLQKECEACNGTLAKYGPNQIERCSCKTADAGKRCFDGDECKGQCLFDGFDGGGREIGHCSDQERVGGCIKIVAKGQSKIPPRIPPPRKLDTCLD